jgi:hypothetical protein
LQYSGDATHLYLKTGRRRRERFHPCGVKPWTGKTNWSIELTHYVRKASNYGRAETLKDVARGSVLGPALQPEEKAGIWKR